MSSETPRERHRIDVHSHFVPPPMAAYVEALGGPASVGWSPHLPRWDLDAHLTFMDRWGIQASVVSVTAPTVTLGSPQQRVDVAAAVNDYARRRLIERHPERFGCFATLPLPDVPAAVDEARRAIDALGLDGVGMLTNYAGVYLGDPGWDPLWELLEERRAVVFVHPARPASIPAVHAFGGGSLPDYALEYPFETARTALSLIYSGVPKRFPAIRWILCHAGGPLPALAFRATSLHAFGPEYSASVPEGPLPHLRRFYYDTAQAFGHVPLESLLRLVGLDQVLFGTDWYPVSGLYEEARSANVPADPGEVPEAGIPAPALRSLLGDEDRTRVERENALALFPALRARLA